MPLTPSRIILKSTTAMSSKDIPPLEQLLKILWQSEDNRSYMKKYLTPALAAELSTKRTALDCGLEHLIVSGVELPSSTVGIFAPDMAAYDVFWELFEPIICSLHNMVPSATYQPPRHMADIGDVTMDQDNQYILSTRLRLARNLKGHVLAPIASDRELRGTEDVLERHLSGLLGDLAGTYHSFATMSHQDHEELSKKRILFHANENVYLTGGRVYRHWPAGRGIFINQDQSFMAWINEEDHLRMITMTKGGHIGKIYEQMIKFVKDISDLEFAHNDRLGYLTFCPTNLGTTLRASVHVRLPRVSSLPCFGALCDSLKLDVRGTHGEDTETKDGVYDISNKQRLGLTEDEAVRAMIRGVDILIFMEKRLGDDINETLC